MMRLICWIPAFLEECGNDANSPRVIPAFFPEAGILLASFPHFSRGRNPPCVIPAFFQRRESSKLKAMPYNISMRRAIVRSDSPPVRLRKRGDVGLVTIANPPVNALSAAVRRGLLNALALAEEDAKIRAAVLTSSGGKAFVAGADISEFGSPPVAPSLPEVVAAMDAFSKPLVAAIDGVAMGGGLEIALACHCRVASKNARFGFPEVNLGLIPGAGGTQRLPRLCGIGRALEIIAGGQSFGAARAMEIGIVDEVAANGAAAVKTAFARAKRLAAEKKPPRRVSGLRIKESAASAARIAEEYSERLKKQKPGLLAPLCCARAAGGAALPFAEGVRHERALFLQCMRSQQRKALVHIFFASRNAAKAFVPAKGGEIVSVAVVGGGTMGAGIVVCLADAGLPAILLEADADALAKGLNRARAVYEHRRQSGRISESEMRQRLRLITGAKDYGGIGGADLIIEAVPENMDLKKRVFAELDRRCKPGAILASNTSSLGIGEIAAATKRRGLVAGMHFFAPAQRMKLLEIVRGKETAPKTLSVIARLAKQIGKTPVLAGDSPGFIGNRLYAPYGREAEFLLEEGATPAQVDSAMRDFGMAMGPFRARDLSGIDNGRNIRLRDWANLPAHYPRPRVLEKLFQAGRLGQKNGAGYYRYPDGKTPVNDPKTLALIKQASAERGIHRQKPSARQIRERCLYALINEGAKVLSEGVARCAADIDAVYVLGYGFPARRGGPMFWADSVGAAFILERVKQFHKECGEWWKPAPLLQQLAKANGKFAEV